MYIKTSDNKIYKITMKLWGESQYLEDMSTDILIDESFDPSIEEYDTYYTNDPIEDIIDYLRAWESYETEDDLQMDEDILNEIKSKCKRYWECVEITSK